MLKEIADKLSNPQFWHSHARGIPREVLVRELNLQVDDYQAKKELGEKVDHYFSFMTDHMTKDKSSISCTRGSTSEAAMPTREEIMAANPGIDPRVIQEAEEQLERLRKLGFLVDASYCVESPARCRSRRASV